MEINPTGDKTVSPAIVTKHIEEAFKELETALKEGGKSRSALSEGALEVIILLVQEAKALYSEYGRTLSPAERGRKIGAGIKNLGFIEAACASAQNNPQFLPSYLSVEQFRESIDDFLRKHVLDMLLRQFLQEVSDSMLEASDTAYRHALEYYNTLKTAAAQRVPDAEAEYRLLSTYFKKHKSSKTGDESTEA